MRTKEYQIRAAASSSHSLDKCATVGKQMENVLARRMHFHVQPSAPLYKLEKLLETEYVRRG